MRTMCITWCHQTSTLFWNHSDCSPVDCPLAGALPGHCTACRHRQGHLCGLTRSTLPELGGCCHWNVNPAVGSQAVSRETLAPLGIYADETELYVLQREEVPYTLDEQGRLYVDPAMLALPEIFGLGTEIWPDEPFWPPDFELWFEAIE